MKDFLPPTESLTVEFKSDRNGYPDRELIEALTCLANTAGGELWLGVEDNGTPSGLHRKHQNIEHLTKLIAKLTRPALTVDIKQHKINGVLIAQIIVPHQSRMVATFEGHYLFRRLKHDGTPECIHIEPDESGIAGI
ncbi:ATP-binding protein [Denitrificimonas sp. JX-1]|uniref:ATP-binding protein n=1 Tax=Denitrificimonas halotolerans TaxID=3098930 RepID=A0ABU5GTB2_9GAMM|nr:ATP-binding protein [Denitrificimonas sp. JX-1]MDY7220220.1 ATP-binding protein [Denitrificimonas sp. JX-1]